MSEKKKFGFGVIGTGSRSGSLVRTLMNDKEKRGDIVALCDTRPSAMERYEKRIKASLGHGCRKYTDYQELLRDPEVDAVVIATPDFMHHMMAIDAFHAGKHVFLEKPVGINLDQMIDIIKTAKESGKILEVGYVLRYSPFYVELQKILKKEIIGRPMFVQAIEEYYGAYHFNRGWWRKKANNGGIMVQKICHDMDIFTWYFGKPKRVVAFESINEFKPGNWPSDAKYCHECQNHCPYYVTAKSRTYSDECVYNSDHDVADNAQVLVEFENGVNLSMGMVFFNSIHQSDRTIKIIGSKAEINGSLHEQILTIYPRFQSGGEPYSYECNESSLGGHGGGDEVQMIEFLNAISEGREAKAGLKSAYWSSILVMAAQISANTGRVVMIDDIIKKYPFPE
ncbi:MAG: Gfo/Idh/MocA family protein [Promethearchaeota archaeon]